MERELQGKPTTTVNRRLVKQVKRPVNLLLVDIYFISAIRFHRTIAQLEVQPFIISLYEIDWIIKEKEAKTIQEKAIQDELTNKKLIT